MSKRKSPKRQIRTGYSVSQNTDIPSSDIRGEADGKFHQGDRTPKSAGLPQRLKEARNRSKLTQLKLARFVGLNRTAISQWESGLTSPSFQMAEEVSKILKVTPEWLCFGVAKDVTHQDGRSSRKTHTPGQAVAGDYEVLITISVAA